ncbi:uncharacterized protein MONBRDRAFT_25519 [Monosiga brevicollis MX1]|uniref:Translation initiation factor eIF2B subunit epsilon n=1 Tax=Monosiga brevicollis TaxID=81824 RepID=A9UZN2_MONBE|nr:uncharacterized protein MONBRDRAFT_25519 [Monosiga brevicollis MX1]EDQ89397.1 predicted protein [Monosiga brevicollis MX1]|eukprot:XP_001745973.1 hypothetical protein [Monosiga brevicollis MX1]
MSINTIASPRALSEGDVLREVDRLGVIKNHFVLVSGDVVSNFQLAQVLEQHKARYTKNRDTLMTMFLQRAMPNHRLRTGENDLTIGIDPTTAQLLTYSNSEPVNELALSLFSERESVAYRYDLIDCHTAICSPQVPMLFTDNFDYQEMFDFIRNVLQGDEITAAEIYTHVLDGAYAARASNLTAYDAISKDVIHRWTLPLVPDIFGPILHRYKTTHNYIQDNVVLARTCVLQRAVAVGHDTRVGIDGQAVTTIRDSVIGSSCRIGSGSSLDNAYVLNDCIIGNNCRLKKVFLGEGVQLLDNVEIGEGCVIGDRVVLGPNITLKPNTKISRAQVVEEEWGADSDEESDEDEAMGTGAETPEGVYDVELVGEQGRGYLWQDDIDEDEEDDASFRQWQDNRARLILEDNEHAENSEDDEDASELDAEEFEQVMLNQDDFQQFLDNMIALLTEKLGVQSNGTIKPQGETQDIALEITGMRSAHHLSPHDVVTGMTMAIIEQVGLLKNTGAMATFFKGAIEFLAPILGNFVTSQTDHDIMLRALEDGFNQCQRAIPAFQILLHSLYEENVLAEEEILRWHARPTDPEIDVEIRPQLLKNVAEFIVWLETAESEEDSDESDSDSD